MADLTDSTDLTKYLAEPTIPSAVQQLADTGHAAYQSGRIAAKAWAVTGNNGPWPLAASGAGRPRNWVEGTFGKSEDVLKGQLKSIPAPQTYSCGDIGKAIQAKADTASVTASAPMFTIVQGVGVNDLHRTPLGHDCVLQVASQFDFQESPGSDDVPVSDYLYDHTQGPQAAIEAAAAALHRKAAKDAGQLPHALKTILNSCEVTGADGQPQPILEKYPQLYQNGYLQLDKITDLKDKTLLQQHIHNHIDKLSVLPQWAQCESTGAMQMQVFCAAPSFQGRKAPTLDSPEYQICEDLVVAQYVATARLAVIRSRETGGVVPLHLTMVGQGAFKNNPEIMKKAMKAVADVVKGENVAVYVHAYDAAAQEKLDTQMAAGKAAGTFQTQTMTAEQFKIAPVPVAHATVDAIIDSSTVPLPPPSSMPTPKTEAPIKSNAVVTATQPSLSSALAAAIQGKPKLNPVSDQEQQPVPTPGDLTDILRQAIAGRRPGIEGDDSDEETPKESSSWDDEEPAAIQVPVPQQVGSDVFPANKVAVQTPVPPTAAAPIVTTKTTASLSGPPIKPVVTTKTTATPVAPQSQQQTRPVPPTYDAPPPPKPQVPEIPPQPLPRPATGSGAPVKPIMPVVPPAKTTVPAAQLTTVQGSIVPIKGDGKIHPYMVTTDYKAHGSIPVRTKTQAEQMLEDFEKILEQNPDAKIAITYSANIEQTNAIINGYTTGKSANIGGGNQAIAFGKLEKLIQDKGLQDKVHILPVTTIMPGTEVEKTQQAIHDMENIATHADAGWLVLGLQNEKQEGKSDEYAIGGGIAPDWPKSDAGKKVKLFMAGMTTGQFNDPALATAFASGKANPNGLLKQPTPVPPPLPTTPPIPEPKAPKKPVPPPSLKSKPIVAIPASPTQPIEPVVTTAPPTQTPEVTFGFGQPKPTPTDQQAQSQTGQITPTEPTAAANAKSPTTKGSSGFTDKMWEDLKSGLKAKSALEYSSDDSNKFTLGKEQELTATRKGDTVSVKLTSPLGEEALNKLAAMAEEAVKVAKANGVAPLPVTLSGSKEDKIAMFRAMSGKNGLHFDKPIPKEIAEEVQKYNEANKPVAPTPAQQVQQEKTAEPQSPAKRSSVYPPVLDPNAMTVPPPPAQPKLPLSLTLNTPPYIPSLQSLAKPAPVPLTKEDQNKLEKLVEVILAYGKEKEIDKLPPRDEKRKAFDKLKDSIVKIQAKIADKKPVSAADIQQITEKFAELKDKNASKPKQN